MNFMCNLLASVALCTPQIPPADLQAYVGKSPFETVSDFRILAIPAVRNSIMQEAASGTVLEFLTDLDAGTTIELLENDLVFGLCEEGACERSNASIALTRSGAVVALCVFTRDPSYNIKPGLVHWMGPTVDLWVPPEANGTCPQSPGDFLNAYAEVRR